MLLDVAPEPVPLMADSDGVVRVGGSRVTLDTVVGAFSTGATAEEIAQQYPSIDLADLYVVIAQQYPSIDLADLYVVIAYYLRHRRAVEQYLRSRERVAAQMRAETETRFDPVGIRERLLARRNG